MTISFFDSSKSYSNYSNELEDALLSCFKEGKYINGPQVKTFEKELGSFLNVKECIACANGSDALTIALRSLNLPLGSEVIIPSFNYVSAAESAVNLGLSIVFCDVKKDSFNTSLELIQKQVTTKTRAVVVTHLFGSPISDIRLIANFCKENNIFLIEDNAQSLGSQINRKYAGTFGDVGTTSFFPTKNLGCAGDGGAIFTNNLGLGQKIRQLASHGQSKKYHFDFAGYNSRLDTIQASLLLIKLKYLDEQLKERRKNASIYFEHLKGLPLELPLMNESHTFNQFTIKIKDRDRWVTYLKEKDIPNMIYYPSPLHQQKAFKQTNTFELKQSEQCTRECLSLPVYPGLMEEEILYICDSIKEFCL